MRRGVAILAALAALGGGVACKRHPQPPPRPLLVEVHVEDRTPPSARPARLDLEAIRQDILRLQREAGVYTVALGRVPAPTDEAWRLRVDVGVEDDVKDGKGMARAVVAIVMERVDGPAGAPRVEVGGGAEQPYPLETPDPGGVFTRLVERTVRDLLHGVLERGRLRRADTAALVAALGSPDAETRLAAVNVAAERRERAAVPALIERLGDPAENVRDRALGALAEIGDRRAVGPLTRQTQFRDLDGMRKVVDAIAALGGDEARAYLELVASGHEVGDIRQLAKEALERMARKEARARRHGAAPRPAPTE